MNIVRPAIKGKVCCDKKKQKNNNNNNYFVRLYCTTQAQIQSQYFQYISTRLRVWFRKMKHHKDIEFSNYDNQTKTNFDEYE